MDEFSLHPRRALSSIDSNKINVSGKVVKKDDPTAKDSKNRTFSRQPSSIVPSSIEFSVEDVVSGRNNDNTNRTPETVPYNKVTQICRQPQVLLPELLSFTPIDPKRYSSFTPFPVGGTTTRTKEKNQSTLTGDLEDLMKFLEGMSFGPSPARSVLESVTKPVAIVPTPNDTNTMNKSEIINPHSMVVNLPTETSLLQDHRELNMELFTQDWEQPTWEDDMVGKVPKEVQTSAKGSNDRGANLEHSNEDLERRPWDDSMAVNVPSEISTSRYYEDVDLDVSKLYPEEQSWDDSMAVRVPSELSTLMDCDDSDLEFSKQDNEDEPVWDNSMAVYFPQETSALLDGGDENHSLSMLELEKFEFLHSCSQNVLEDAERERDWSQQWATQMKQAVLAWVQHQRALIEYERRGHGLENSNVTKLPYLGNGPTANDALGTGRQSNDSELHEAVHRLQLDFKVATKTHEEEKRVLEDIIQQHQGKIRDLEQKLADCQQKTTLPSAGANTDRADQVADQSRTDGSVVSTGDSRGTKERLPSMSAASKGTRREAFPTPPGRSLLEKRDGSLVIHYRNGTRKETHPDGTSIIRFPNGDIQTTSSRTGTHAYYHANAKTIQVRHADGSQIFEFPNQQVERHFPDGRVVAIYPDGTKKKKFPNGSIETTFADGIHVLLERPDGKREVRKCW